MTQCDRVHSNYKQCFPALKDCRIRFLVDVIKLHFQLKPVRLRVKDNVFEMSENES